MTPIRTGSRNEHLPCPWRGRPIRERQILLLAAEHTSADIAGRLRLAVATVNNNLARAYHKLGISGRSQLRELLEDPASAGVGGPPNVTA